MALNQKVTIEFAGHQPLGISEVSGIVTYESRSRDLYLIKVNVPVNGSFMLNPEKLADTIPPPTKDKIEYNRFKQDCRKRAFDMAHSEKLNTMIASKGEKGGLVDVEKLADQYYKWLISIPE